MKVDNFVLLIISIVTLIIISLLTECNRGRLTELENKATKEIVETFFHLGSADPTEEGQKGYKITDVTEGKYGGRSSQVVINQLFNTGSHSIGDYISENEKTTYDNSNLFSSTIGGTAKQSIDCIITTRNSCRCLGSSSLLDNPLDNIYNEITYTPPEYGGFCSESISTIVSQNNKSYKPMPKGTNYRNNNNDCTPPDTGPLPLIIMKLITGTGINDYLILYKETEWCGYISFKEVVNWIETSSNANATFENGMKLYLIQNTNKKQYVTSYSNTQVSVNYIYVEKHLKNILYPDKSIILSDASDADNIDGWTKRDNLNNKYFVGKDDSNSDSDFGSLGGTGGSNTITITTANMPSHYHRVKKKRLYEKGGNTKNMVFVKDSPSKKDSWFGRDMFGYNRGGNKVKNDPAANNPYSNHPRNITRIALDNNIDTSRNFILNTGFTSMDLLKKILPDFEHNIEFKTYHPAPNSTLKILPLNANIFSKTENSNNNDFQKEECCNDSFIKMGSSSSYDVPEGSNSRELDKTPDHRHSIRLYNDNHDGKGGAGWSERKVGLDNDSTGDYNESWSRRVFSNYWGGAGGNNVTAHDHTPPFYNLFLYKYYGNTDISSDLTINELREKIPIGTIIMNYDDTFIENTNVNGWIICNGDHNTPDLRGKFIKIQTDNSGGSGGSKTTTLESSHFPSHRHILAMKNDDYNGNYGGGDANGLKPGWVTGGYNGNYYTDNRFKSDTTGDDEPISNLPAYYVVNYIMYVGILNN